MMMKKFTKAIVISTLLLLPALAAEGGGRALAEEKFEKTLIQKDLLLFEQLYGHCDLKIMDGLIAKDFEFYHDKGGANHSKKEFMTLLKQGACKIDNTDNKKYKSYRVLTETSLKHYPLYENDDLYAVLQTGIHSFYESYKGGNLAHTSTAKFSNLWILEKNKWVLSRVFSYDHQMPKK
jgi:hypothetical protein